MPEAGHHHVLDGASFAVRKSYLDSFAWRDRIGAGLWRHPRLARGTGVLRLAGLWRDGFAIPLRVVEMVMGFHEIVNREVVLAIVEAGAASDGLLAFVTGMNRPHQHDVANIPGVNSGREFLGRGQDGRDGFFVVLKIPEMLVA